MTYHETIRFKSTVDNRDLKFRTLPHFQSYTIDLEVVDEKARDWENVPINRAVFEVRRRVVVDSRGDLTTVITRDLILTEI